MTSSIRKTTNTISSSNCKKTTSKRESTIVRAKETHSICKENSYITCIKSPFATDTEKRSETTAIRIDQTINAHSNKETSQTYSALLASWTNICSFWTNKPIPLSLISVGSFYTFEKRYYVFHPITWFVCVCICLCVCLCVCHHVCGKMAGLSNMVSSKVNTI